MIYIIDAISASQNNVMLKHFAKSKAMSRDSYLEHRIKWQWPKFETQHSQ